MLIISGLLLFRWRILSDRATTTRGAFRIGSAIDRFAHTTRYTQLSAAPFKDFWRSNN
jgi:hypothetical protein